MDAQFPRRFRSPIEMLSGSLPSYVCIKARWMNREKNWNDGTEGGREEDFFIAVKNKRFGESGHGIKLSDRICVSS